MCIPWLVALLWDAVEPLEVGLSGRNGSLGTGL